MLMEQLVTEAQKRLREPEKEYDETFKKPSLTAVVAKRVDTYKGPKRGKY